MEKFEEICEEVYSDDIRIVPIEVAKDGPKALYIKANGRKLIALPHSDTEAQRTCMLTEQYGHYVTGDDRVLYYDKIADWKAEARARRYAHDRLLTPDAIRIAAQNTDDEYEIAFALNVTVEFLRDAIDCFKARGLWSEEPCIDNKKEENQWDV